MIASPLRRIARPQNREAGDDFFKGLDLRSPAERLPAGYLQRSENFCFGVGGDIVSRPPFVGQLTTPLPGPLFAAPSNRSVFYQQTGEIRLIFGSQNGKLYYWVPGTAVPVEITRAGGGSANISYPLRGDRKDRWYYFLDATGTLCRTDTTSAEIVTGLDAPATAPTVQLTSRVINAFADPSVWAGDTFSGAVNGSGPNPVVNPAFDATTAGTTATAGTGTSGAITGWTVTSGMVSVLGDNAPYGTGRHYVLLQQAGTSMQSADVYAMPAITNTNGVGSVARYAKHVRVSVNFYGNQSTDSLLLEILGYASTDGSGQFVVSSAIKADAPTTSQQGKPVIRQGVADLSGAGFEIRSYRLRVTAGPTNQTGAPGPYGTDFVAAPFDLPLTVQGNGPLTVYGNLPSSTNATLPLGGEILSVDLGAATNFSKYATLTIPFSSSNFADASTFRARLGFRSGTTATRYLTNLVTVAETLDSLSVDITTITAPAAKNAVRYVDIVFDADTPVVNALPAGQNALFSIGALTDAGSLSLLNGVGLPVTYLYSYFKADTGATGDYPQIAGVESSGSPYSVTITPTTTQAQTLVTLTDPPQAGDTHAIIWRVGGVFPSREGRNDPRRIAFVPLATDTTSATGYEWNHTTRVLRDNVPDSAIAGLPPFYETGRNKPPTGCTDLVASDYRLWLATGNKLWASWLSQGDETNALYFTDASDPDDPEVTTKGESFSLSSSYDGDKILGLQPVGVTLHVFRQQSYNVVLGDNATNFSANAYLVNAGVGLLARDGFCLAAGTRVWFLAAGGILQFAENDQALVSAPLKPALNAQAITPTDYTKTCLVSHDDCVFVLVSGRAYVYHAPIDGEPSWTQWTGTPLTGALSAVSVAAAGQGHDLYIFGGDGQIYKLGGAYGAMVSGGDKATPAASQTAITATMKTRRYPAPGGQVQTPNALQFDVFTMNASGQTLTWLIGGGAGITGASNNYTFTSRQTPRTESVGSVKSRASEVQLSASVTEPMRVFSAILTVSDGGVKRG